MAKHLERKHPKTFAEYKDKEKKRQEELQNLKKSRPVFGKTTKKHTTTNQRQLGSFFQGQKYSHDHLKQQKVTKKLAYFIGTSRYPKHMVNNKEFRDVLESLDSRYAIPGSRKIDAELNELLMKCKQGLKDLMDSAKFLCFTTDIWSQKGSLKSFLGVTAHFYDRKTHERVRIVIANREFPHPHTGERIKALFLEILQEYEIDLNKVSRVLSDNGSNMVKALRELQDELERNDKAGVQEPDEVEESDSESDMDNAEQDNTGSEYDDNDDDEDEMDTYADEINFIEAEEDVQRAFGKLGLSCYCHTLQLVVNKIMDEPKIKKVCKKAKSLVKKFNKSGRAIEKLVAKSGKKIPSSCPTRWSSYYFMISTLIEMRKEISDVCEELGWDTLPVTDWKLLSELKNFLKPFADHTYISEGEAYTTVSLVIPSILELISHLDSIKGSLLGCAEDIKAEVNKRFEKYLDPKNEHFDPIYVSATYLDPSVALILDEAQINAAKTYLLKLVREGEADKGEASDLTSRAETENDGGGEEEIDPEEINPPSPKKSKFSFVEKAIQQKLKTLQSEQNENTTTTSADILKDEMNRYMRCICSKQIQSVGTQDEPLEFWKREVQNPTHDLFKLTNLALDLLCIVASSAPAERTFSTAGDSLKLNRHNLSSKNLEREVLLRLNKNIAFLP